MKKWIALLLVMAMPFSAAACRRKSAEQNAPTNQTNQTNQTEQTNQTNQTEQTNQTNQTEPTRQPETETPLSGSMEDYVNKIMEQNPAQFMGGQIPVDLQDTTAEGLEALKSFTGLNNPELIRDIAVYEPMMGSQAFSLVLVRVTDPADTKAIAQQMKNNIDPRKWICAMADQVMAAGYKDVALFVMLDSQLGLTAQSYVDAFAAICGGKLDFTI